MKQLHEVKIFSGYSLSPKNPKQTPTQAKVTRLTKNAIIVLFPEEKTNNSVPQFIEMGFNDQEAVNYSRFKEPSSYSVFNQILTIR